MMRDIYGFLAFSHGWTWGWWLLAALLAGTGAAGATIWQFPAAAAFFVGGAGVMIGGLVMTGLTGGKPALRDLARRIVDPRPIGWRWWLMILAFYPVLTITAALLGQAAQVSHATLDYAALWQRMASPGTFLALLGFILLIGPLPEEIGWRGFLLDRLLTRFSALTASLIVALAWWSWHLPLGLLPGYFEAFDAEPRPFQQLAGLLPASVLYTWIYVNTGRSVLAVILFHFLGNLTGQLLDPSDTVRAIRLVLEIAVAALVLIRYGPATLQRPPPPVTG